MEEKRDHKIYKYTNKVNGKVYIGKTRTSLQRRAGRNGERYSQCTYFGNAIKKYGWDNFEPVILEDNLTPEEATIKEVEYIKEYDSTNPAKGYNLVDTVQSDFSDKTIEKLSNRNKGKNNPMWGKHLSERHKDIIRECNRNRVFTDEMRANASRARKGVPNLHRRKPVMCIETGKMYCSQEEAAKDIGGCGSQLGRCCNGKRKTYKGFHWKYIK